MTPARGSRFAGRAAMLQELRPYAQRVAHFFEARSREEREERTKHALALLLVFGIAAFKYVTRLTVDDAPFMLYGVAVAASAAAGGLAPAAVATLAALLVTGPGNLAANGLQVRLLFVVEAVSLALLVSALRSRFESSKGRALGAEDMIERLRLREREERARDEERRREWDEYRQAATGAQAQLQQAADDTRHQLAALESLTDPSLNPLGGVGPVTELLERLRVSIRADGVALVQPGRSAGGLVAARGLQPLPGPLGRETLHLTPGRVTVVHNDPARVRQLSAAAWQAEVASLLVVPVVYNGEVWSTIEIVSERSRDVTDWDVVLVRVVADRLAAVVVQDRGLTARAS